MTTYNKLVRNKILQITKANGKIPTTRILPKGEYIKEIHKQKEATSQIESS